MPLRGFREFGCRGGGFDALPAPIPLQRGAGRELVNTEYCWYDWDVSTYPRVPVLLEFIPEGQGCSNTIDRLGMVLIPIFLPFNFSSVVLALPNALTPA